MSNFYTEPFVSAGEMEFPSQPYITAQPQNHTAWGVEDYVLTVIAAGAVSYQWEVFDGESWHNISGATSDTLAITIDPSMDGWRFRVLVTGADGSTVTSKAAQIAVKGVQEIILEGAIVTFNGPATISSLVVDINAVQSGSGDPSSPTNIRPISGWNSVNVVRTGKNLLVNKFYGGIPYNGTVGATVTLNELSDVVQSGNTFSRAVGGWGGFGMCSDKLPNGTYYLKAELTSPNMRSSVYVLDKDMAIVRNLGNIASGTTRSIAYAVTLSGTESRIAFGCSSSTAGTVTITAPQIELGSTATDYEPYQDTTYPIALGSTVYGGQLDVTSGELTVTHGYIASYNGETLPGTWISDRDVYAEGTTPTTGAEVVYELATPTTVQLTPVTDITTLTGVNNLWADSGDVQVTIIR